MRPFPPSFGGFKRDSVQEALSTRSASGTCTGNSHSTAPLSPVSLGQQLRQPRGGLRQGQRGWETP